MDHGRNICRQLKQLRRDIADQNGIELHQEECTYKGHCDGTCPHCDAELQYIERELARRQGLGKAAIVAGTVLTMALCTDVMAQTPVQAEKPQTNVSVSQTATGTLKGNITDGTEKEPLMNCRVALKRNGKTVYGTGTDFDGNYTIKNIEPGEYDIVLTYPRYRTVEAKLSVRGTGYTVWNEVMERSDEPSEVIICGKMPPVHNFDFGEPATIIRFSADDIMHFPF